MMAIIFLAFIALAVIFTIIAGGNGDNRNTR